MDSKVVAVGAGATIAGATAAAPLIVAASPALLIGLVVAGGSIAVATILAMRAKKVTGKDGNGREVEVDC